MVTRKLLNTGLLPGKIPDTSRFLYLGVKARVAALDKITEPESQI